MTSDEISFLVVLGMFLEGFAGELQDAYHAAPVDDLALARFRATELIEEAEHLQFCLTALRSLVDLPDPAEHRSRIHRLVEVEDAIYRPIRPGDRAGRPAVPHRRARRGRVGPRSGPSPAGAAAVPVRSLPED